jgi:hypothetical protein
MTVNLYDLDATGVQMKDCGGNLQSGMESCVAFAPLPGQDDAYIVGDTKLGDAGPTLRFTGAELEQFFSRWSHDRPHTA